MREPQETRIAKEGPPCPKPAAVARLERSTTPKRRAIRKPVSVLRACAQPTHQLNDIDGGSNGHMAQMGFGQTDIARAASARRAHSLRMGPLNARSMAIGVLELIRLLSLACCKQRQHLLSGCKVSVRRVVPVQQA